MSENKKHDSENKVAEETVTEKKAEETGKENDGAKGKKKQQKGSDWQAKLSAAEQKAADSDAKATEAQNTLMRVAAEYDNYRKRSQKEHEAAFTNGVAHAVNEMLPIVDVLEAAANAPTQDEDYKKGVYLTLDKCKEVFDKLGVEEIECLGKEFDPELHNAVMQEDMEDVESGCVCRVVQKGYVSKTGKVVRHAMVSVKP